MKKVLFSLLLLTTQYSIAQQVISLGGGPSASVAPGLPNGSVVPSIAFPEVMNAKKSTIDLAELKGKAVILEFWATWCGPCLPAMTHLDELKKKFGDKLEVIAISDESAERIQRFIKNKPSSLSFVSDPDHRMQQYFPYHAIPHAVLIDKNGKLAAATSPDQVTASVVESLLDGATVKVVEKKDAQGGFDITKDYFGRDESFNDFAFDVQPAVPGGFPITRRAGRPTSPWYGRRITLMNSPVNVIYREAFAKTSPRTIYEGVTKEEFDSRTTKQLYCIDVVVPKGKENELYSYMRQQLQALNLEYKCRLEKRKMEVAVLTTEDASILKSMKNESGPVAQLQGGPTMIRATNYDKKNVLLSDLVSHCESFGIVNIPIVDETGAADRYDINFAIEPEDPASFKKALARLGLKVQRQEREVEVLVIYRDK